MGLKACLSVIALMAASGCGGGDDGGDSRGGDGGSGRRAPSGSDAPTEASLEDFCSTYEATQMISGYDAADQLAETGTPSDIPQDARAGFEFLIDHPGGGEEVINNEDINAYVTYGSRACVDLIN